MLDELFNTEQVAEKHQCRINQMEILNQISSMAEHAIQGQRRVLICEAFAELQNRDEMYRQLEAQN